ncbi:MAG TPA: hypothetical protein VK524_00695 [Polyangiaceae bacterium]|nr:hypothetical protein [Polyangiaceae bacterium]
MNRLKTLGVFIALVLGPGVALADTSYPGHMCLTQQSSMIRTGSKYENIDETARLNVACPVVRTTIPGGVAFGSRVFVVDQHATSDVSCTLSAKGADGTTFAFDTQTSSGSSAAVQILDFNSLIGVVDGHYTLWCSVPDVHLGARSSIVSYLIKN